MHQKDLARKAWEEAGLYRSRNERVRAFLEHVERAPLDCWPDLADLARTMRPEDRALLVTPLWNTGDKLLRLNLIRLADPAQQDEVAMLRALAGKLHPREDIAELRAMARIDSPEVLDRIGKVRGIDPALQASVGVRRKALLERRAAEERAQAGTAARGASRPAKARARTKKRTPPPRG